MNGCPPKVARLSTSHFTSKFEICCGKQGITVNVNRQRTFSKSARRQTSWSARLVHCGLHMCRPSLISHNLGIQREPESSVDGLPNAQSTLASTRMWLHPESPSNSLTASAPNPLLLVQMPVVGSGAHSRRKSFHAACSDHEPTYGIVLNTTCMVIVAH